jgi:hypothetical protein
MADDDPSAWLESPFPDDAILVRAAVVPSSVTALLDRVERYRALLGVGFAWIPCADGAVLASVRERAASLGGVATTMRGPSAPEAEPPLPEIQRKIKAAFDPSDVLPGSLTDPARRAGRGAAATPAARQPD